MNTKHPTHIEIKVELVLFEDDTDGIKGPAPVKEATLCWYKLEDFNVTVDVPYVINCPIKGLMTLPTREYLCLKEFVDVRDGVYFYISSGPKVSERFFGRKVFKFGEELFHKTDEGSFVTAHFIICYPPPPSNIKILREITPADFFI